MCTASGIIYIQNNVAPVMVSSIWFESSPPRCLVIHVELFAVPWFDQRVDVEHCN